jgi:hypothetical protein
MSHRRVDGRGRYGKEYGKRVSPPSETTPPTRHMHPNTFILIIKPTTPIFKN